jgi:ABC-type lipoprotein release transport system permease subunit
MVLQQGLRLGAAGVAAGLVLAFFCCRAVASLMMVGLTPDQSTPLDVAAIGLPLLLITMLATLAPARRASRVDPIRALRDE